MKEKRLREKLAGLFVWGFEGTSLSPEFVKLLKCDRPAGVILFKRNIESLRQVRSLTKELRRLGGRRLLIGVDEEGGRVSRMPPPFTRYPSAVTLGDFYRQERDSRLLVALGRYLARELLAVGINTDFAPVLDVNSNPKNPVIGDRSFSSDPQVAAEAATAFFLGMEKEGMISCGKHFPGHGDTRTDSHLTLPRVPRSVSDLNKVELVPFRMAIRRKIPMLMTAHVVYPAWDPKHPATLSHKILTRLLRQRLGFCGVVISDDLQMKAMRYSESEACLKSLEAGVDLLLICKGGERGGEIVEQVLRDVGKSPLFRRRVFESLGRVRRLKEKYL